MPETPNFDIPYPAPTDRPSAAQLQALALQVDEQMMSPVGRGVSGVLSSGAGYGDATSNNVAGPWSPTGAMRAGGCRAEIHASITAYAGGNQDCAHVLQAQINGGQWLDLASIYQRNTGTPYLPLGGSLIGHIAFDPAGSLTIRLTSAVAAGGFAVVVGAVNFSATFF